MSQSPEITPSSPLRGRDSRSRESRVPCRRTRGRVVRLSGDPVATSPSTETMPTSRTGLRRASRRYQRSDGARLRSGITTRRAICHFVAVSGDYAFASVATTGVIVLDITNPAVRPSSGPTTPTAAYGIAVSGDYAFVAAGLTASSSSTSAIRRLQRFWHLRHARRPVRRRRCGELRLRRGRQLFPG